MNHRACKRDVAHIDTPHGRVRHKNMTLLAGYPFILLPFVLTTSAFVAILWAEDLLCIEPPPLWPMRTIVDRFRFCDLAYWG